MSMFVYKGGGRGQKWAKICLRGLWKPPYIISASGEGGSTNNFLSMFSDDMCQIDAGMADQQFHTNPPILQANETCEIGKNHAYKNYEYSFAISPNV